MEETALIISALSLLVAGGSLVWNELRWRTERRSNVQVLAWHDGMGMDIYSAEAVEVEHVIALRVFNRGERPEHVMWTGLESLTGEPLADDRPKAAKIVDDPRPDAQELPPRGQIAAQFKLPAGAIADGLVGYAMLGTGDRIYSVPITPDPHLGEIQSDVRNIIADQDLSGEDPSDRPP
jgi:hypothetical protein